jgi:hypothetical protein
MKFDSFEALLAGAPAPNEEEKKGEKKPMVRAPTLQQRIKKLKGPDGLAAYKWARKLCSDHEVHIDTGNVKLFELHPMTKLKVLGDKDLISAIDYYTMARSQYMAFLPGSTSRNDSD